MQLLTSSNQPIPKIPKEIKDIVFLTLTLGWKNEKRPSGPTELDLEAGNLVLLSFYMDYFLNWSKTIHTGILSGTKKDFVSLFMWEKYKRISNLRYEN